ncbi:MAG: signal peptide peptidase SppA, partial [Deltaproteobacteria bacterium]|nr:signal peptide peptidase SppA [Deltaproteobacteria bacterium]
MGGVMKRIRKLTVIVCIFLAGCVSINLPKAGPMTEKVIGGKGKDKVLLIEVSGIITDVEKGGLIGLETSPNLTARIKEELSLASSDDDIKALILKIDTPGGSVTASDIIAHEIKEFRKKKGARFPVVAALMGVAASGGYYIAASADKIVAHPTTVTGSIGVIAYGVNASGLMEKVGLTDQTIKSGDKKDAGSPLRQMTPEERRIIQSVIDAMYERFLDVILETRGAFFKRDELQAIADGRVYTARQARDLKLVDMIGYMDDVVALSKEMAGIKEAAIVTYAQPGAYRNNIYSMLGER